MTSTRPASSSRCSTPVNGPTTASPRRTRSKPAVRCPAIGTTAAPGTSPAPRSPSATPPGSPTAATKGRTSVRHAREEETITDKECCWPGGSRQAGQALLPQVRRRVRVEQDLPQRGESGNRLRKLERTARPELGARGRQRSDQEVKVETTNWTRRFSCRCTSLVGTTFKRLAAPQGMGTISKFVASFTAGGGVSPAAVSAAVI